MPDHDPESTLHLINPLRNPFGGSERRTLDTLRLLREHCAARVWAAHDGAPSLIRETGAEIIRPALMRFPRRGTFVFVGTYFSVGRWMKLASPARVVVIFNTDQPHWLRNNLSRISAATGRAAEVIYTSIGLRARHRGTGPVLESHIDVDRFGYRAPARDGQRPFTVGRLSRDDPSKHHRDDPALYRRLAADGVHVRLMGATGLAHALAGVPNIEILPEGAVEPLQFLRGLDAFIYRTSDTWYEAFGRVVFEAMAAGVPVVCSPAGGYAHYLVSGSTALLGADTEALHAALLTLRDDAALAAAISRRARHAVEAMQRDARRQLFALLLGGNAAAADQPSLSEGPADDRAKSALPAR